MRVYETDITYNIKELLNYYAIIVADKATIELKSQEDVIEYVEKPRVFIIR